MKLISFFNQKGGVGKTTSVVNLAATFSMMNKKVLVIDCDSQMTASNYLLTYMETQKTINDYFIGADINSCIVDIITKESVNKDIRKKTNISLIPSCKNIETIDLDSVFDVSEFIKEIKQKFDYCLFDLPPHLSGISLSALIASDYVIVPAHADTDSLAGYDYLIDTINTIKSKGWNTNLKVLGILFNDVISQRMTQKYILEQTQGNMKDLVFPTIIKSTSKIEQARFFGIPLPYSNLDRKIINDYKSLAKDIEKKIRKESNNG